jgi:hypothetical protein
MWGGHEGIEGIRTCPSFCWAQAVVAKNFCQSLGLLYSQLRQLLHGSMRDQKGPLSNPQTSSPLPPLKLVEVAEALSEEHPFPASAYLLQFLQNRAS